MKTANTKVRLKDLRAGVTVYTAHPHYGIEKRVILGRPYVSKHTGSLFVKCLEQCDWGTFEHDFSTRDAGITGLYNGRRTFFKLKHAQAWAKKWQTQPGFRKDHARHEAWCREDELSRPY
jgi:hypothetical protein